MAIKASNSITIADVSDGIDGTGIETSTVTYQAGSSGTEKPTGEWSDTIPETSASAPYLWTKVTYTYTDGRDPLEVYSVGSTPEGTLDEAKAYVNAEIKKDRESITLMAERVTANESSISELKVTADSIETRVSDNEGAISNLQQTASGISVRLGDAETAVSNAQSKANSAYELADGAQSTANDASENAGLAYALANGAQKVATNYLRFDSEGLAIGDYREDGTLSNNVLIDSTSVNIRDGDTILSKFTKSTLELGNESTLSAITMGSLFSIVADDTDDPMGFGTTITAPFLKIDSSYGSIAFARKTGLMINIDESALASSYGFTIDSNTYIDGKLYCTSLSTGSISCSSLSTSGSITCGHLDTGSSGTIVTTYITCSSLSASSTITASGKVTCGSLSTSGGSVSCGSISSSSISCSSISASSYITSSSYISANGNITTYGAFYIGSSYSSDAQMQVYWKDYSYHSLVARSSTGLGAYLGWEGSYSYATVTTIRGRTCRYSNSSGTTTLSDERLKKDFSPLDKWDTFFDKLDPCAFKMKAGNSGRYHLGFKAQQVENALINSGLTTDDFAGFVKTPYVKDEESPEISAVYEEAGINPGDDEYGLIYTEFTALNTYEIQKLKKRIEALEDLLTKEE